MFSGRWGVLLMETAQKLKLLKDSASYDVCSSNDPRREMSRLPGPELSHLGGIYQASTPRGCSSLFKVLLSNKCVHNCSYCANARSANIERTSLSAEELARTFLQLYQRRAVQGLFLSSAVDGSPESTMDSMIKCAEILRYKSNFSGFIHLKILPGVSNATITQACRLASRVSINIEAPTKERLQKIAGGKNFTDDILRTIGVINAEEKKGRLPSGQTTQFVVGAAGENDQEILNTSAHLYRSHSLRRIYFSAFIPLEGTPLENSRRTAPLREHRLYQCDFLMREYAFSKEDIVLEPDGNLPLNEDPKMNYAENHPELYPVEVNRAPRELLLKVPGVGPLSAQRIIKERQYQKFQELKQLRFMGVVTKRAAQFLLLDGKQERIKVKKNKLAQQLQFQFSAN
jgi:putative DNA modification/repair radical SAM protein